MIKSCLCVSVRLVSVCLQLDTWAAKTNNGILFVWKFGFWPGEVIEKSWNFFPRFLWEPWVISFNIYRLKFWHVYIYISAVDNPKFMGRPPDHPWRKTGLPKSFLGCPNYFIISLKYIFLILTQNLHVFHLIMFLLIESWVTHRATLEVMLDRPTA